MIRDVISKTTQQILLISLMIASVNSWVDRVHFSDSKLSICQSTIEMKKCPSRKTHICTRRTYFLRLTSEAFNIDFTDDDSDKSLTDETINLQWRLFGKHHARCDKVDYGVQMQTTSWVGKWSTHNYVGDVVLETMPASVNYVSNTSSTHLDRVDVTHTITTGSTLSDCETCFDDPNSVRTIPITTYTPDNISCKSQYANNRVEADHGRLKARLRPM